MREISAEDFANLYREGLDGSEMILDVREPEEWEVYRLNGAKLMPLQTLPFTLNELPKDRKMYILCAHGIRSVYACNYLSEQGFDAVNVEGGMARVSLFLEEDEIASGNE
ncbi:rhodanese-like domain-containing protein [Marinithermofilum abyssi]|uniref:Rhodanese-like domain-containing protein n=1 Tax=Marinithermofilum abyssi TaxID=1571185 RepID=A0A8J2VER1_9BACL|nr:rhodanese-like domain-containing protein [Marinithermofilum abyssi]GGE11072.1 rhodanese-like domain-containing protein [Marinithermofilum abyssi]